MKPQESGHLIDGTLEPVEARKLKVVSLPTKVVQYCRQPGGGLENDLCSKSVLTK